MFRQTTNQNHNPVFRSVTSPNGISDLLIQTFIWEDRNTGCMKSLLYLFLISMAVIENYAYTQQHAKSND